MPGKISRNQRNNEKGEEKVACSCEAVEEMLPVFENEAGKWQGYRRARRHKRKRT
jgi:hypothetical protein